jgi:ornithine cyclodeaminase
VHALNAKVVPQERFVELGEVIAGTAPGRTNDEQITIADLTGLAVQDIQIANLALRTLEKK